MIHTAEGGEKSSIYYQSLNLERKRNARLEPELDLEQHNKV